MCSNPDYHLEVDFCGDDEEAAREAYAQLWAKHEQSLSGQAHRQAGGNREVAEEALAQLEKRLWERRKQFDPSKGRWRNWAGQILQNIISDIFRKRRKDPVPLDDLDLVAAPEKDDEIIEALRDCIARLPADLRKIIELRLAGMTMEQIGELFGVGAPAIYKRIQKALELLRQCLESKGFEGGER